MRGILSTILMLVLVAPGLAQTGPGRIVVTGQGSLTATPDMATISVGVTREADTAGAALETTSITTGEVLTLLSEMGIEPEDMQTSALSLSPVWRNTSNSPSQPEIAGYRADNTIRITVRSLPDLGVILDDIVASGANQFNGLSFGVSNPGPLEDDARAAAVVAAKRKAQLYADAAGVSLGALLSISEAGAVAPGPVMMEQMAVRAAPVPVAPGALEIRAEVTLVYAIQVE